MTAPDLTQRLRIADEREPRDRSRRRLGTKSGPDLKRIRREQADARAEYRRQAFDTLIICQRPLPRTLGPNGFEEIAE